MTVERRFAKSWRDALSGIDLDALFRQGREIIKRVGRPTDLLAAKVTAAELVRKPGSRYVAEALADYDLKTDLAKLDAHYSQLSDEEKLRGVMSFAHYPPVEGDFLTSKLWDQLMRPEWREWAQKQPELGSKENDAKVVAEINNLVPARRFELSRPVS